MKNNNGKVAIAIVAMFVVALSVVGFTYAYFTASVSGNKANTESVKVTAGTMKVVYDMGDKITTNMVIPGWKNDGKSFYDPVYSAQKDANGITRITAVSTDDFGEGKEYAKPSIYAANATTQEQETALAKYGLKDPVTFSVTNDGTRDAYYSVSLTKMVNNLSNENGLNDKENLEFSVYVATSENGEYTLDKTLGTNGIIPFGTDSSKVLYDRVTLPVAEARYYKIIFHYKEAGVNQTASDGTKDVFAATVTVDGLEEKVVDEEKTTFDTPVGD